MKNTCNHIGTKKDRLPILRNWYYCHGCETPFNKQLIKTKNMNKDVRAFLKRNGFKKMETNSYANDTCNVVITKDCYEVSNNVGNTIYSNDLQIYWLIGVLTFYGHLDRNYRK